MVNYTSERERLAFEDGVKHGLQLATARLKGLTWPLAGRWRNSRRRAAQAFDEALVKILNGT